MSSREGIGEILAAFSAQGPLSPRIVDGLQSFYRARMAYLRSGAPSELKPLFELFVGVLDEISGLAPEPWREPLEALGLPPGALGRHLEDGEFDRLLRRPKPPEPVEALRIAWHLVGECRRCRRRHAEREPGQQRNGDPLLRVLNVSGVDARVTAGAAPLTLFRRVLDQAAERAHKAPNRALGRILRTALETLPAVAVRQRRHTLADLVAELHIGLARGYLIAGDLATGYTELRTAAGWLDSGSWSPEARSRHGEAFAELLWEAGAEERACRVLRSAAQLWNDRCRPPSIHEIRILLRLAGWLEARGSYSAYTAYAECLLLLERRRRPDEEPLRERAARGLKRTLPDATLRQIYELRPVVLALEAAGDPTVTRRRL